MAKLLFLIFIFESFVFLENDQIDCFPMIWNQGVTKKSWVYLNQDEGEIYKKNSDITEGDALKMSKNSWDAIYTDAETKQKFSTADKRNASFKFVTLGYKLSDQKKKKGFDFTVLNNNKKINEPYIFRITNNSQNENPATLGSLKEVGFVFDNWPQYWANTNEWTGGTNSFSDNYQIEKLDKIIVKFKFRLINYNTPLNKKTAKEKLLGSYATCDLRFNEYDENGKIQKTYLLGVIFSNPLHVDFNDKPNDDVLWELSEKNQMRILIHGNKNKINEVNTVSNTFQTVEIDFKPLIKKYLAVNLNKKNIITGLDIYSATRSVDFTYDIQDIQVIGCGTQIGKIEK
jgi:hypothetical protein